MGGEPFAQSLSFPLADDPAETIAAGGGGLPANAVVDDEGNSIVDDDGNVIVTD